VGEFIQGHRDSVVLATKYSNAAPGNDPNAAGNQANHIVQTAHDFFHGCEAPADYIRAVKATVTAIAKAK
jgi:hypothetical protein